jgi:AraC-like DNA-binding protein
VISGSFAVARLEPRAPVARPAAVRSNGGAWESRRCLLDLPVGRVEDLRCEGARPEPGPEGFCGVFQVCLPYRGLFVWHVGGDEVVGDANQVIFVRAGEPYRMSGPLHGGYAETVLTPEPGLLAEIAHVPGRRLAEHPLFTRRAWRAEPELQRLGARFRDRARQSVADAARGAGLAAEEAVVELLRAALRPVARPAPARGSSVARLVRRAKEFLEAELPNRILLADVARAAGASPAHLTSVFRRVEGVPLHRYLTQLRLARALAELPHADDLTTLALDLGFSSHSHFTAAFRAAFGSTPSRGRAGARSAAPVVGARGPRSF